MRPSGRHAWTRNSPRGAKSVRADEFCGSQMPRGKALSNAHDERAGAAGFARNVGRDSKARAKTQATALLEYGLLITGKGNDRCRFIPTKTRVDARARDMHRIDPWTPKAFELAEPVLRIADNANKRLMMVPS